MASVHRRNATNYALDISEERERDLDDYSMPEASNMLCIFGAFHLAIPFISQTGMQGDVGYMSRFDSLVLVPFPMSCGLRGLRRVLQATVQARCMHVARPQVQKGSGSYLIPGP